MKFCPKCEEEKTLDEFSLDKSREDNRCHSCKECQKKDRQRYSSRTLEHRAQYAEKNLAKLILAGAKTRAKKFNLDFDLELEDIKIPERCPVLGLKIKRNRGKREWNSVSIDRIDNSKGYIKGNVSIISWRANHLKAHASLEELKRIIKYIEGDSE